MHSHRTYPHGLKVEAAKAIFERGMTNQEAMRAFGIKGKTRIETWCRPYQLEGPDAPPQAGRQTEEDRPALLSCEEESEARVHEPELEPRIQTNESMP